MVNVKFFHQLRRLLKRTARSPPEREIQQSPSSVFLPDDILLEIAEYLSPSDIRNLALTSPSVYLCVRRSLYAFVSLEFNERAVNALQFLSDHPEIARHVRKLVISNREMWVLPERTVPEITLSHRLGLLAADLLNLHTLIWDGRVMPPGWMWDSFRTACPRLRNIGCSVYEYDLPHGDSPLLRFTNLLGFSLWIKPIPAPWYTDRPWDAPIVTLPDQLWDMLHLSCPNLRELTIHPSRACRQRFDVTPFMRYRWPNLRTLMMGDTWFSTYATSYPDRTLLNAFMAAHPDLETLGGVPDQLSHLPDNSALRHLDLTSGGPLHAVKVLCNDLRSRPSVTSLSLRLDFYSDWLAARGVTDLYESCLQILHLEVFSQWVPILHFSAPLHLLPRLVTLTLVVVEYPKSGSLLETATNIFQRSPRLQQLKLKFTIGSWNHLEEIRLKHVVTYVASRDADGRLIDLAIHEHRLNSR